MENLPPADSEERTDAVCCGFMNGIVTFLRTLFRRDDRGQMRDPSPDHEVPPKRSRHDRAQQRKERKAFFRLFESDHLRDFLARDSCMRIADKYLLAMVLVYFRRAGLRTEEYSQNFFPALFLANQMEEDLRFRDEIYPWDLGHAWRQGKHLLRDARNHLLIRLKFRAWVDRPACDLVMAEDPSHWIWSRERQIQHSWAIRRYRRHRQEFTIYGPWRYPPSCVLCQNAQRVCQAEEDDSDSDSSDR